MLDGDPGGGAISTAPPDSATLAERLAALPEQPLCELKQAWAAAWGSPPPKGARRRFLLLGIAWRWQARIHGGFSRATERRLATLEATVRQGNGTEPGAVKAVTRLLPGTRLLRQWRGEHHEIHVVEGGYIWQGRTHASLSAIARAITGSRRNGPAFFGLRECERGS